MTKDSFFSKAKKTKDIEIDGETYTIRKLRQGEVETMKKNYSTEDKALEGFRYIVACVVLKDDGEQMFDHKADKDALAGVDYDVTEGIATAAMEYSGLTKATKKN